MENNNLIAAIPEIKGPLLDVFLEAGWYRYGDMIFTTNVLEDFQQTYSAYWLRYDVPKVIPGRKEEKIIRKGDGFVTSISDFKNSDELEELHSLYFESIKFITSFSIADLMIDTDNRVFDSKLLTVRNNGRLIAAGIFDEGKNAIAGIKNIYHPEYKKYSFGKYMMWKKLQYCLKKNIKWYYPGYFAPGNDRFDYKLDVDRNATEVLIPEEKQWVSLQRFFQIQSTIQLSM